MYWNRQGFYVRLFICCLMGDSFSYIQFQCFTNHIFTKKKAMFKDTDRDMKSKQSRQFINVYVKADSKFTN